jgi:hypothetical protein
MPGVPPEERRGFPATTDETAKTVLAAFRNL